MDERGRKGDLLSYFSKRLKLMENSCSCLNYRSSPIRNKKFVHLNYAVEPTVTLGSNEKKLQPNTSNRAQLLHAVWCPCPAYKFPASGHQLLGKLAKKKFNNWKGTIEKFV
ncbi:hypothetical protein PR048_001887 [Dryococelus australis]|uniref:Uncharacterized protein n=1 Tax=Dryococelus australis TaxID=614101 RepID=A0ABQ9IL48_9NEOP|nr:hypothetical protein PR048_001887 [Dryococelus australis]